MLLVLVVLLGLGALLAAGANSLVDRRMQEALSLEASREQLGPDGGDDDSAVAGADEPTSVDKFTLVSTVDGFIHAVDSERNEKLWTTALPGGSLATSHQVKAFVADGSEGSGEDGGAPATSSAAAAASTSSDGKSDFSVVPSADGSLMIHNMQGMRKTSVKARMLAEKTPFVSQEGLLFTGQTSSRILGVDVGSGKIVHDSGGLDDGGGKKALGFLRKDRSGPDPLWIGRVDYTVRAYNQITGREQFNLTYSELKPLSSYSRNGIMAGLQQASGGLGVRGVARHGGRLLPEIGAPHSASSGGSNLHNNQQQQTGATIHSTPEGEVSFPDSSGIFNTFSMGSAAVSAFSVRLRKKLVEDDASNSAVRSSDFEIQPLKVMYRMNSMFAEEPQGRAEKEDAMDHLEAAEDMVVVQSLANGGLYALEIPNSLKADTFLNKGVVAVGQAQRHLSLPSPSEEATEEDLPEFVRGVAADDFKKIASASGPRSSGKLNHVKGIITSSLSKSKLAVAPTKKEHDQGVVTLQERMQGECVAFPRAFTSDDNNLAEVGSLPLCLVGNHKLILQDDPTALGGSTFLDQIADDIATLDLPLEPRPRTIYPAMYEFIRFVEYVLIASAVCIASLGFVLLWMKRVGLLPGRVTALLDRLVDRKEKSVPELQPSPTDYVAPPPLQIADIIEFDDQGNKITCVGSIRIFHSVLGYGSHGTLVLKGSLNGRPVAVKRMLSQFNRAADREIALLIRSDGHPNVVRYFLREQKGEFVYLALQLCKMSLRDFVMHVQRMKISKRKKNTADVGGVPAHHTAAGLSAEERKLTVVDIPDEARTALLQIAQGLAHLHSQRIVHRDIKPHNILLALPDDLLNSPEADQPVEIISPSQLGGFILKISDMGLSKQLDREEGSFASMSFSMPYQNGEESSRSSYALSSGAVGVGGVGKNQNPVGTIGWQAPELMALRGMDLSIKEDVDEEEDDGVEDDEIDGDDYTTIDDVTPEASLSEPLKASEPPKKSLIKAVRKTQTVDIFSLGCVFHYVLVPGEHPFGQWFEREANIMTGKLDLSHLQHVPDALDLLTRMLRTDPHTRPSSAQVCHHPFFWSYAKRLDFLTELSDRLEHEPADSPVVLAIERNASAVLGGRVGGRGTCWDKRLDTVVMDDMSKYRKYDTTSVRDLLRVVRNKRHHFHELGEAAKGLLGPVPSGFVSYFEDRFPELLLHCTRVACTYLRADKGFKDYCGVIAPVLALRKEAGLAAAAAAAGLGVGDSASAALGSHVDDEAAASSITETDDSLLEVDDVVVWAQSALAEARGVRGWFRESHHFVQSKTSKQQKQLNPLRSDPRFRTKLCGHWQESAGQSCPMKKRSKCSFAHGGIELRVKQRWGKGASELPDALNAARTLDQRSRMEAAPGIPPDWGGGGSGGAWGGSYGGAQATRSREGPQQPPPRALSNVAKPFVPKSAMGGK